MKCLAEFPRWAGEVWLWKLLKGFFLILVNSWLATNQSCCTCQRLCNVFVWQTGKKRKRESYCVPARQMPVRKRARSHQRGHVGCSGCCIIEALILLMKISVQIIKLLIDADAGCLSTFLILSVVFMPHWHFAEDIKTNPSWSIHLRSFARGGVLAWRADALPVILGIGWA